MEEKALFKLDLKDRRILYALDANARQSASEIGKTIGLPTGVVNYRLKRLEEEGIITRYQAVVDLSKLGIIQFKLCLVLQHLGSRELEKILSDLKKHPSVKWIATCKGRWDMIVSVETDSIYKVESLKNEILATFGESVYEKAISIAVSASAFSRNYFLEGKKQIRNEKVLLSQEKKAELDEIDIALVRRLSEDGRKSVVDLAEELETTPKVVQYRIKQLISKKIITGFKLAIDYEKLDLQFYKAFIYLDSPEKSRVNALKSHIQNNKNIIHNVEVIGNWDFEPEFEVHSEAELDKSLEELKDNFSDIIKKIDLITISKEHKLVYF